MANKSKSRYEEIFGTERRGGRKKLDSAEKARRKKMQKIEYARRAEAKKRAYAVLAATHEEEFKVFLNDEYGHLAGDPKFDVDLLDA